MFIHPLLRKNFWYLWYTLRTLVPRKVSRVGIIYGSVPNRVGRNVQNSNTGHVAGVQNGASDGVRNFYSEQHSQHVIRRPVLGTNSIEIVEDSSMASDGVCHNSMKRSIELMRKWGRITRQRTREVSRDETICFYYERPVVVADGGDRVQSHHTAAQMSVLVYVRDMGSGEAGGRGVQPVPYFTCSVDQDCDIRALDRINTVTTPNENNERVATITTVMRARTIPTTETSRNEQIPAGQVFLQPSGIPSCTNMLALLATHTFRHPVPFVTSRSLHISHNIEHKSTLRVIQTHPTTTSPHSTFPFNVKLHFFVSPVIPIPSSSFRRPLEQNRVFLHIFDGELRCFPDYELFPSRKNGLRI